MTEAPRRAGAESHRLAEARDRAQRRLHRQRAALQPLGALVMLVVALGAAGGHPRPGLHGSGAGVTACLCVFAAALALATRSGFAQLGEERQAVVVAAMATAGVALVALQPRGASELAAGVAVWFAITRLRLPVGIALGAATTVALDVAAGLSGGSAATILAATLLAALLGLVAYFLKESRASQDRTELLLAQLEDAREDQTRAAALAERSRIAGELHDVLAHSLSGAAIQLQGARKLAEREQATPQVRAAIDRAGELVKDGLASARQAVGALRGEELPGVAHLDALVSSFRDDHDADVDLSVEGHPRALAPEAGLALYRGAQEALTNVARYAPGATTRVVLRYDDERVTLTVEDRRPASPAAIRGGLPGVGGGRGLTGLRERVERVGGSMQAGPVDAGWRVQLDVPS